MFATGDIKKSDYVKERLATYTYQNNVPERLKEKGFEEKMKNHYYFRLKLFDQILLLFHYYVPCIKKISCWRKKDILTRLYARGRRKIIKNLNVFHLLTQLKEIMLLVQK